jgi:hypothetical protein
MNFENIINIKWPLLGDLVMYKLLSRSKEKSIFIYTFLLSSCFLLQGCIPILVGAAVINDGKQKEAYTAYANEVMKDNTQREIHGLKPNPTMTYEEWKKSMGIKSQNDQQAGCSPATNYKC